MNNDDNTSNYDLEAEKFVYRYKDNPVGFVQDVLRWYPYQKQKDILESMLDYKQVAVSACHAAGITATLARLGLWWLYTHPQSHVFFSAPTVRQLRNVLGVEFSKAVSDSKYELVSRTPYKLPIHYYAPEIMISQRWRLFSFTDPQDVYGYNPTSSLYIFDCAGSISKDTWEHVNNQLERGATLIAAGNAIAKETTVNETGVDKMKMRLTKEKINDFYSFYKDVETFDMRIDIYDTPNFSTNDMYKNLITKEFADNMAKEFGKDSDFYKSRVRGRFI